MPLIMDLHSLRGKITSGYLALAYYFLCKQAERIGKDVEDIGPQAMAALVDYGYPGNIRELENIIERAVTFTRSKELTIQDLPPSLADHNLQVVREKD